MFAIHTRTSGDALILDLVGPLGRAEGEAALQAVQQQPALPRRLVLNFGATGPISTAVIGGLLLAVRMVSRAGGQVSAYGLCDHFRKVFHVMGLTEYIRICPDESSALE